MTYCIAIQNGMWAFLGLMTALCGLVLVGVMIAGFFERRGVAQERRARAKRRKVQVNCATRVGPRLDLPTRAANDPYPRS